MHVGETVCLMFRDWLDILRAITVLPTPYVILSASCLMNHISYLNLAQINLDSRGIAARATTQPPGITFNNFYVFYLVSTLKNICPTISSDILLETYFDGTV